MSFSSMDDIFELLLREILADYEFDAQVQVMMDAGQRKLFEDALIFWEDKFKMRKLDLNLREAQRMIFFANPTDMLYFVHAIAKKSDKNSATRMKMLSMFFSLHLRALPLLEAFVQFGGLVVCTDFLNHKKNQHIQSQAMEIIHKVFTLPDFCKLADDVQSNIVEAGQNQNVSYITKAQQLLYDFKHWDVLKDMLFSGDNFFEALEELLTESHDVFPNSRASACKLLGFCLQVFCQPFYRKCESKLQDSMGAKAEGKTKKGVIDAVWYENINIPVRLYTRIVHLYEEEGLPGEELEVLSNLLNYLNNFEFDADKMACDKEEADVNEALYKAGRGEKIDTTRKPATRNNEWLMEKDVEKLSVRKYLMLQMVDVDRNVKAEISSTKALTDQAGDEAAAAAATSSTSTAASSTPEENAVDKAPSKGTLSPALEKSIEWVKSDMAWHLTSMKRLGNVAFKNRNFTAAEEIYEKGVRHPLFQRYLDAVLGTYDEEDAEAAEKGVFGALYNEIWDVMGKYTLLTDKKDYDTFYNIPESLAELDTISEVKKLKGDESKDEAKETKDDAKEGGNRDGAKERGDGGEGLSKTEDLVKKYEDDGTEEKQSPEERKALLTRAAEKTAKKLAGHQFFSDDKKEEFCGKFVELADKQQFHKEMAIVYTNLAFSELKLEKPVLAVENATRACVLDPTYVKGFYRLAEAYMVLNKKKSAMETIGKAVELDSKDKNILALKTKIEAMT